MTLITFFAIFPAAMEMKRLRVYSSSIENWVMFEEPCFQRRMFEEKGDLCSPAIIQRSQIINI
jgi:hypothetical protein